MCVKDPFVLFKIWHDEAFAHPDIKEPGFMCLSTTNRGGIFFARRVILRKYSHEGFVFYTYHDSFIQGQKLKDNLDAHVLFRWVPLKRYVSVHGTAVKFCVGGTDPTQEEGQAGSSGSEIKDGQSEAFRRRFEFSDRCLTEWVGYILKPHEIQFWEGETFDTFDRVCFRLPKENDKVDGINLHQGDFGWVYEILPDGKGLRRTPHPY